MEDGDKRDKRKVILRGMEARKSILILISGAGGWRGRFSAGASNQISLMKWSKIAEPAGPGATDILSWAP